MSTNPESLRQLGAFWTANGGVNLGVVGNDKHCVGYHLGRDRIFGSCACRPKDICVPGKGANDYSVQHPRDKAGLTNAASAIDLGRLNGSYAQMRSFSRWLVAQCQAKAPGTEDIREVIYTPDGETVQRYSGVDGLIHTGPGNGDMSHLTHTHISYFRDSEFRDKRPAFAGFFVDIPDTGTGDTMTPINAGGLALTSSYVLDLPTGVQLYDGPGKPRVKLSRAATVDYFGNPADDSAYAAVLVTTAAGFADGVTRPVLLYVRDADAPAPRKRTDAEMRAAAERYAALPDCDAEVAAAVAATKASARIVWG